MHHHDNAKAHTALLLMQYLSKNKIAVVPQLQYSPDLAPSNFFLFVRFKKDTKRDRFGTADNIQAVVTRTLKSVSQEQFEQSYEQWKKRWIKCIDVQGAYFVDYRVFLHVALIKNFVFNIIITFGTNHVCSIAVVSIHILGQNVH